jgi:hypothetical protein
MASSRKCFPSPILSECNVLYNVHCHSQFSHEAHEVHSIFLSLILLPLKHLMKLLNTKILIMLFFLFYMLDFFFCCIVRGGFQTGFTRDVGHFWSIAHAPGDCEDGEFGGLNIGRGNRNTRRKPAPAPIYPPQIPLGQTRARTQAAAVGSQRLTAWAMTRPALHLYSTLLVVRELIEPTFLSMKHPSKKGLLKLSQYRRYMLRETKLISVLPQSVTYLSGI